MITFKCSRCGYTSEKPYMICPRCGGLMRPVYNWRWSIGGRRDMNSFRSMLPPIEEIISLGEAWTPLIESRRLFNGGIYFKDEGRNPTGSFRDRAASLVVSYAYLLSSREIVLASDGNMGVSVSAYSARAGLKTRVYVSRNTDPEKILLMKAYGAKVIVRGEDLDELLRMVDEEARNMGLYNASSTYNSLSIDGLKTIAYEIFIEGIIPDRIYLPLGSGLTLLSIYYGFMELYKNKLINRIPLLIGVETCGNPIYGLELGVVNKPCREKAFPGLNYRKPIIYDQVLEILRRHGRVIVVSRRKTIASAKKLSRYEGLFVEPSSAVALAGAMEDERLEGRIVILLTGHGLKGPSPYLRGSRLRGMRIFPGSTKHLILKILAENPGITGYEVWKELGLQITPQAVYQHLRDLENHGYISSRLIEHKKEYYITGKARKLLD